MADSEQKKMPEKATVQKAAAVQKPFGSSPGRLLWLGALGASLLALLVYGCTLTRYLYPGESAVLYTQWMGLDTLSLPLHPIWGGIVKSIGLTSAVRLNMLGLVCGVLSAGFLCYLVGFFVYQTIGQEDVVKHARTASLVAGVGAALVYIFSTATWMTSTHLDVRQFDVALALAAFMLYVPLVRFPRLTYILSPLLGFVVSVGVVECSIFVPLALVFLLALVATVVKNGYRFYVPTALFLVALVVGYLSLAYHYTDGFYAENAEYKGAWDVLWACANSYKHEIYSWIFRSGGIVVIVLAVLPFIACTFASSHGLNNERTWSQYLFHAAMTVCCILATATPLSPEGMTRQFGTVPVATTTLVAATCGYLLAYWFLLARVPLPATEFDSKTLPVLKIGRQAAPYVGGGLAGLLLLAGIVNAFSRDGDSGAFADRCATEILDHMGTRTWLITDGVIVRRDPQLIDGLLDAHLRVAAKARGQDLHIICLKPRKDSEDKAYRKMITGLVTNKVLTADADLIENLSFKLKEQNLGEFLKTWFKSDPNIKEKVAIVGRPDFWIWANCRPVPESLFFGGVHGKDLGTVDGLKLKADFETLWGEMEPVLVDDRRKGSRSIREVDDPIDLRRLELRRHLGFIANNLGVLLQDLGHDDEAYDMYELVLGTIDCDNICALLNVYEMFRAGKKKDLVARKQEVEQLLKDIVADPSRRYSPMLLANYYGYVRSPEFFVRSGFAWARSGQTGYAIEHLKYAGDLAQGEPSRELLHMMASCYAQEGRVQESREVYENTLKKDAENHEALIGLWQLSLQEGDKDKAKHYLERAVKVPLKEGTLRLDEALLHMMNNNFEDARMVLTKLSDLHQNSLQVWTLRAAVELQQVDKVEAGKVKIEAQNLPPDEKKKRLQEIENQKQRLLAEIEINILPKMEAQAESPRDFFVQMTRAQVLLRKDSDKETLKQARAAFEVAWMSRPVVSVGAMVLDLDFRLRDRESAERHALQILRMDDAYPFANWVMGSIRMMEGKMPEAEKYLRSAVAVPHPSADAQNDLAELLRKDGRLEEAEKFARAATKTDPKLYVAWETLASTLLDRGTNLGEAEQCIQTAIELFKDKDPRLLLTKARVQLAKKNLKEARLTLRELGKRSDELNESDRAVFDKLLQEAQIK